MRQFSLPRALRMARARCDMSQGELAEKLGVSSAYVSLMESGQRSPRWQTIEEIAAVTKLRIDLLIMLGRL